MLTMWLKSALQCTQKRRARGTTEVKLTRCCSVTPRRNSHRELPRRISVDALSHSTGVPSIVGRSGTTVGRYLGRHWVVSDGGDLPATFTSSFVFCRGIGVQPWAGVAGVRQFPRPRALVHWTFLLSSLPSPLTKVGDIENPGYPLITT